MKRSRCFNADGTPKKGYALIEEVPNYRFQEPYQCPECSQFHMGKSKELRKKQSDVIISSFFYKQRSES